MTEAETSTVAGAAASVANRLVSGLTPQFLGMILLNAVFILAMTWLLIRQNEARERVLAPLLGACSTSVPIEALKLLYRPEGTHP